MAIIHVICTAYKRPIELRHAIDNFLMQTNNRWMLNIIHDGEAPTEIKKIISSYSDLRIKFTETISVNGKHGHPNRKFMLEKIPNLNIDDYVLITNEDNYYVPVFVEYFLEKTKRGDVGLVYCDTIHSYMGYDVLRTQLKENFIDMGSFIVRLDIAKEIGFNHEHLSADGKYAEECAKMCIVKGLKTIHIQKCLFVHN